MPERDWLLEIGCEEIPARFVEGGLKQLKEKTLTWLKENRISHGEVNAWATPRRLTLLIKGVADQQEDVSEEVRGPAQRIAQDGDGNWTKAAEGFARKQGVDVTALVLKEHKGETYVFARKQEQGKPTIRLMEEELPTVLDGIHFPKAMRWGSRRTRFIRPVRWMVCLWGNEEVPLAWAGVTAGRETRGHRFLGSRTVLESPASYMETLRQQHVIVDAEERREMIRSQLKQLEEQHGWTIPVDPELLDEVTYLVETPTALYGRFDEAYLKLPPAVLITTMREHQRYFPVEGADGQLLPYFVTVRNGNDHALSTVARGNEKVLSARLADARFFYEEDQKLPIATAVEKLDQVVYYEDLGTIGDQVRRIRASVQEMAGRLQLPDTDIQTLLRAAEICKFDLSTQMVYEFPELSGLMGRDYALKAGEDEAVADAIEEHHYPRAAGDRLPQGTAGALISLADKIDAVVSAFAIGIQPTGSQDPYGLRRRAAGAVQILTGRGWSALPLSELTGLTLKRLADDGWVKRSLDEVQEELDTFFRLRIKAMLQEAGIRYDIIDAVLAAGTDQPKLVLDKARTLAARVDAEAFKSVVEGFSRAANLAKKDTDGAPVDRERFESQAEHDLWNAVQETRESFETALTARDTDRMLDALSALAPSIHAFFEEVLVMADDEAVRRNRLALLREIDALVGRFAAFNQLVFAS
ncbi:glycine--tRNA ligase subunit beta [Desmospora profundinema]|uniref:Glycine--tRNA ligase beta subunit n=1 Tax=Desmospora profundinema TaxID=1571184 RepID=A0ABU1IJS2_9BACL|nr:glycine--tRNA ligase subunit beta [Desmospora profundinema]MDR6225035.1 glycyl-tRNA synthetase beta chain [Desmospora profundinema]